MCRGDPNASVYVSERQANVSRRDPAKKLKPKKTTETSKKPEKSKKASFNQAPSSSVVTGAKHPLVMADKPPAKRRCLSADQKLALTTPVFVGVEGRLTRRSSRRT